MFDIGGSELLMIVVVAVVVIGPKDLPLALRVAGRWIGKMRKVSNHFRSGIDAMVREAELEDMERKWREQNEAIMKAAPQISPASSETASTETAEAMAPPASRDDEADAPNGGAPAMTIEDGVPTPHEVPSHEPHVPDRDTAPPAEGKSAAEPQLPLDTPQQRG